MLWVSRVIPPRSISSDAYITAGVIVYVLCLYAVAVRCKAWVVIAAGVVTVVGAAVIDARDRPDRHLRRPRSRCSPASSSASRRGSREQLAVAERRHEGERALLEERQRIARELHDVVAHHMSVIAIQAEAAPYKTADPPKELVESFAEIRASALSGLNELRRVLGVLRSDRPDVAPQPGLDDLDGLLESARNGGVTVTSRRHRHPPAAPGGRGPVRLPDRAGGAEQRHAARAGIGGPGGAVLRRGGPGHRGPQQRRRAGPPRRSGTRRAGPGPATAAGMASSACVSAPPCWAGTSRRGPTANDEFLVTAALPLADDGPEDTP